METFWDIIQTTQTNNSTIPLLSTSVLYATISVVFILVSALIITTFVILILSCIFHKKQPLKSRGCTFAVLLVVLIVAGLVLCIRSILILAIAEQEQKIRCYVDLFGTTPLSLIFVSLLIARNLRFIFLLNINKIKNLIFGSTRVSELLKENQMKQQKKEETNILQNQKRKSIILENSSDVALVLTETISEENVSKDQQIISSPITQNEPSDESLSSSADEIANYFDQGEQKETKQLKKLRCLRFMTSYYITFAIVAVVVIVWYLYAILYMIISQGTDPNCSFISPGITFACSMILYLISFLIFSLDLLLQYKDILKCRLQYLLCQHDKYLFRIEFLLIASVNLIFVWNSMLLIYIPGYFETAVQTRPFLFVIIAVFLGFIHLFALAGFVLFVSMIWECRAKKKKNRNSTESIQYLDVVMKDEKLQTLFRKFCEQEWSLENFLCYQDITLWSKRMKSYHSKLKTAIQIYDRFIKSGASLEVNIPNYAREFARLNIDSVYNFLKSHSAESFTNFSSDQVNAASEEVKKVTGALEIILKEVKLNLNDTLYRFTLSSEFKQHMDALQLKEIILQNG